MRVIKGRSRQAHMRFSSVFSFRLSVAVTAAIVACGSREVHAWTSPVNITNLPSGSRAFGPRTACDGFNNLHLVWTGGTDPSSNWQVWYQSNSGGSWNTPTAMSTADGTRGDIAIDSNNNIHLCYEDDAEDNVWYRRWTAGGWTAPVNIMTGGRSISSRIAVNAAGDRVMIAWHEDGQTGGEWDIFAKVYSGGAWGATFNVSNDSALSSEPRVAIDSAGNFHVIWQSAGQEVHYRKRNTDGSWSSKTRLDHTSNRSGVGSIAVAPDNFVHVAFSEDDGTGWEIFHTYFNGTAWSSPINVSSHGGTSDDISPSLAIDSYSRLYVAWHDYNNIFFSSRQDLSSSWSAREAVVAGKYLATDPDIAVDGNNIAHVFWQSRPTQDDNWNVYCSAQASVTPGPRGTVSGIVRNQYGVGVSGATVTVAVTCVAVSGAGGAYSVLVPPGTHSATAGKPYYSSQTVNNITVLENQTTTVDFAVNGQAPSSVTQFNITAGNQINTLNWTNPSSGNFGGTVIRFSTSGYPAGPSDGTLLTDQSGNPGSSGNHRHTGLTNGTGYYYSAFSYYSDASRYYAAGIPATGTPAGPGDFDRDGDVDSSDFGVFQRCYSGAFVPQLDPACLGALFDVDTDVDQEDYTAFMVCFKGSGVPADPGCSP